MAALECVQSAARPSQTVRDALVERMEAMGPQPLTPYYHSNETGAEAVRKFIARSEYRSILQALVAAKDGRVLARLLRPFTVGNEPFYGGPDEGLQMVLQMRDKRTIVTLMGQISNATQVTNIGFGDGKQVQVQRGDIAMAIILAQTNQDLAAYGYYLPPNWKPPLTQMGFADDKKRQEARKRVTEWFKKNQKEYEGVERIQIDGEQPVPASDVRSGVPGTIKKVGA